MGWEGVLVKVSLEIEVEEEDRGRRWLNNPSPALRRLSTFVQIPSIFQCCGLETSTAGINGF
jgi:hypothetical protein